MWLGGFSRLEVSYLKHKFLFCATLLGVLFEFRGD
jgi:hypothetical protein